MQRPISRKTLNPSKVISSASSFAFRLVVAAASPEIVVSVLRGKRLGLSKGIYALIVAVATCNDVIAIFLFGVVMGIVSSTGILIYLTITLVYLNFPVEI